MKFYESTVLVEITNECNLNCKYCYNSSAPGKSTMSLESYTKILNKLMELKIKKIIISGGEPFLHPNILEFIDITRSYSLDVLCITNGNLVTKDIMDYILNSQNISIQLSLDGASIETDDILRGKGHFSQVIYLMSYLNDHSYKIGKTKMTVNKINHKEIIDFYNLSMKYNFDPRIEFVLPMGRARDYWNELKLNKSEINRIYNETKSLFKPSDDQVNGCILCRSEPLFSLLIKANGDIYPCPKLYDEQFKIGNAYSENIFDESKIEDLMIKLKNRLDKLRSSECTSCIMYNLCNQGCASKAFYYGNFYNTVQDSCRKRIDFLFNNMDILEKEKLYKGEL